MRKHIQRHLIKSAFQCKRCSYSVGSANRLARHVQLDHKEKLGSLGHLSAASSERAPSSPRPFWCNRCGYRAHSMARLKMHGHKHRVQSEFQCPLCSFSSKDSRTLDGHLLRDHNNDEPFNVDPEDDDANLLNVASYRCDSCDYSASNSWNLKLHTKKHSWNEKFKCPRCTYSSKKQQGVDQHLKKDHRNNQMVEEDGSRVPNEDDRPFNMTDDEVPR